MGANIQPGAYHWLKVRGEQPGSGVRSDISGDTDRFVDFFTRESRSDLDPDAVRSLCRGKYLMHWKGLEIMKDPLDIVIYQQLIWELKPKSIFELGAYVGGTAAWMGDILRTYNIQGHVYSVDLDLTLIDERAKAQPYVTFIQGDLYRVEQIFPGSFLQHCQHPWIVIEDSHVNVTGSLAHFHRWMQPGDYFIVEDTNPDTPAVAGMGLYQELGYERWGEGKLNELRDFMRTYGADYRVDIYYTDMFGYNGTWNWNGYLRKMNPDAQSVQ